MGATRTERKRAEILVAATELFLSNGYRDTSMDEVAAAAAASKQTVYKHFHDKESLFREIVADTIGEVSTPFQQLIAEVGSADDVPAALHTLARRYILAVMSPELLRRRQLVVREAGRLPDLALAYHQGAPQHTLDRLAVLFDDLAEREVLRPLDPVLAASHFAFLVLGQHLDTVMFRGELGVDPPVELERWADAGVDVFLAAYSRP